MKLSIEKKIELISRTPVFDSLSLDDYDKIAKVTEEIRFNKNSIIFRENEIADAFYIIVGGIVEILKEGEDGQQEILAEKGAGEVFGEMAVIDDLPRSATIKAKEDIILLKISKKEFTELLKSFSHISFEMARSVCYTVRTTNQNYIRDLETRNKELEQAYEKLKKAQDELIRAEKLSIVGKFASLIIHDIRNPMTNIRAYAELIELTEQGNVKVKKSTDIIIKEVDRLTKMTSELLEFARGEINLNKTPINITSYIETLTDTVKEDLKNRNIKLLFDKKADCVVLIDGEKMKRVFFNLISNARDAIESVGVIRIQTIAKDRWVKWIIEDNGSGMDSEVIKKIFEPFYTRKKKGTGLGMAIVKGIIESHGGIIKVFSELGKGTKFVIFLPKV